MFQCGQCKINVVDIKINADEIARSAISIEMNIISITSNVKITKITTQQQLILVAINRNATHLC